MALQAISLESEDLPRPPFARLMALAAAIIDDEERLRESIEPNYRRGGPHYRTWLHVLASGAGVDPFDLEALLDQHYGDKP